MEGSLSTVCEMVRRRSRTQLDLGGKKVLKTMSASKVRRTRSVDECRGRKYALYVGSCPAAYFRRGD